MAAQGGHRGPQTTGVTAPPRPTAPRAGPALLGMLLFIIADVMIFGTFFTAYFFMRVVSGAEWPAEGDHLRS